MAVQARLHTRLDRRPVGKPLAEHGGEPLQLWLRIGDELWEAHLQQRDAVTLLEDVADLAAVCLLQERRRARCMALPQQPSGCRKLLPRPRPEFRLGHPRRVVRAWLLRRVIRVAAAFRSVAVAPMPAGRDLARIAGIPDRPRRDRLSQPAVRRATS